MSARSHKGEYVDGPDPAVIAEWKANLKARELYDKGVNYTAISIVIAEYHGITRSRDQWRSLMTKMGVKPRAARGWATRGKPRTRA